MLKMFYATNFEKSIAKLSLGGLRPALK